MVLLDDIKSNKIQKCLRCGVDINEQNDSGWEAFTEDGGTTQPVCKECNEKDKAELATYVKEGDKLVPERN